MNYSTNSSLLLLTIINIFLVEKAQKRPDKNYAAKRRSLGENLLYKYGVNVVNI